MLALFQRLSKIKFGFLTNGQFRQADSGFEPLKIKPFALTNIQKPNYLE